MSNSPLSKVCVCGGRDWHVMMGHVIWCRRCGCLRLIQESYWRVPLDRTGDLASTVIVVDGEEDPPTLPGTPTAKKT